MKKSIATAALASTCMAVMAASDPDVNGQIIDVDGEPMSFVNVVLLSVPDSAFVQGATSDLDGNFNIQTPATGGILKVSSIGYETLYINTRDFDGRIQMREDAQLLTEVTVKGQRPKTKLTGNSMVTDIQGTVLEKSGTAKEMLAKVPGMTQKGDDLEVLGKGAPIYYINGRKVNDLDELKRLRSEEIKDVEVITNPGSQYDATVTAVVRIKTVKRQGNGFGYDLGAGDNQDLTYGSNFPNAQLNLRYRHNDVDVFGGADYWRWNSVNIATPTQMSYLMTNGELLTISQKTRMRNDWRSEGINANAGVNWQISADHSVGLRLEHHAKFGTSSHMDEETQTEQWLPADREHASLHSHSQQDEKDHTPYNWEGNAYYSGKAGKLGMELNLDFLTTKVREETDITEYRDAELEAQTQQQQQMQSVNRTSNVMYAGKLVLTYPLWKGQLNAGTEMTFVTRKARYDFAQAPGRSDLGIPNTGSKVQENNVAAFVEYSCQLPKVGDLSAGVRFEHVGFDYTDLLDAQNSMTRYTDDFFPSASWSRQWGSVQTSVSYSYKTQRPTYWQLNETMMYINPYSRQMGDPKLKNEKIQEVSLNARWSWINLYVAYERRDDALTQWSYIYNDEGVILLKHINLSEPMRNVAAFLSLSPTWGCYSPNWTLGVQKFFNHWTLIDPREATGEREVSYTQPIGVFNLNNTFRLKHSWQLECNAYMMTRGDVMNFSMRSASCTLNFVVQKCWLKNDALCLRATVNDVLQKSRQQIMMDCGYYTIHQDSRSNQHRASISLRYTFNSTPSKYKGTGAGKEAASRMGKS